MMLTWRQMDKLGYDWNENKAAAALLYAAVFDGFIHKSQITVPGYNAISWAEGFLRKLDKAAA